MLDYVIVGMLVLGALLSLYCAKRSEDVLDDMDLGVWPSLKTINRRQELLELQLKKKMDKIEGQMEQVRRAAAISEKLADRAFSLASSANVGLGILSKSLAVRPRHLSKEQSAQNQKAKEQLADLFGMEEYEYLKPLLNDEELDILEKAQESYIKVNGDR